MILHKILCLISLFDTFNCVVIGPKRQPLTKREANLSELESPHLANCASDFEAAEKQHFVIKNGFSITPVTSTAQGVEYTYAYTLIRWEELANPFRSTGHVLDASHYRNRRNILYFAPFSIDPGIYRLTMKSSAKITSGTNTRPKRFPPKKCYFVVRSLPPIVVLKGGDYFQSTVGRDIYLDAKDTVNPNKESLDSSVEYLSYEWKCTQKVKVPSFCKNSSIVSTDNVMKIPKKVVVKDQLLTFRLSVGSAKGSWASVVQTIEVVPGAASLSISCIENCPFALNPPNYKRRTYLRAECINYCDKVKPSHLEWNVTGLSPDFQIDYNKDTYYGRVGTKFIVSENFFKPNNPYIITLALTTQPGKTRLRIRFPADPETESCKIVPSTGISLQTYFKLSCDSASNATDEFFEVIVDDNLREVIMSGFAPDVFEQSFFLPPSKGHKFNVRVTKQHEATRKFDLKVQVDSLSENSSSSEEILNLYNKFQDGRNGKTISSMIASGVSSERKEGIRMFQTLVDEIIATDPTPQTFEFAKNMTYAVVQDMLKSPPAETLQLLTMSDAITKIIVHTNLTDSDPYLANLATSVCKLMIVSHAKDMQHLKFPLNAEAQFNTVGSVLTKCSEANIHENFDLLRRVKYNITIQDVPPADKGIIKDYPAYVDDDDDYNDKMENFHGTVVNILAAHQTLTKALSVGNSSVNRFAKSAGNFSAVFTTRNAGINLSKTKIEFFDVSLIPSGDFKESVHQFDIMVSLWSKDIMWWNFQKTRIITDVVQAEFWHANCKKRIKNFKDPAEMLLKVKHSKKFDEIGVTSNVTLPVNYSTMSGEVLNNYIRTFRVDIPAGSVLYIQFHNMSQYDQFDTVITKWEFPTISNFNFNETVNNEKNPVLRVINAENYAIWGFLGMLPSKTISNFAPGLMFFDVTFEISFCVRWNPKERSWMADCKPGLESSTKFIACKCRHFSVIAGYMQYTKSVIQEVLEVEAEMEPEYCRVIFFTLAGSFVIFCLMIIPKAFAKELPVYFLADNIKSHSYAYLIIVRTDNKLNAGTTSNVMIKLGGSVDSSEPHVLNYPDPKMYLLQRDGTDMFVLTTKDYLGPIKKIELWCDCSGPSPSWKCLDIVVYDLQKHEQWYFYVKTKFAVYQHMHYLEVTPKGTEKKNNFTSRFSICNQFHTWMFWACENNFSYLERLTVVYSNVLLIYTLNLVMQDFLPSFQLNDVFDIHHSLYITFSAVATSLSCSFMSFIPHIIIAWICRFSNIEFYAFNKKCTQAYDLAFFCWIILSVLIFTSNCTLIIFGFWVPLYKSYLWLITSAIAIVFDILFLENMFIIVQTFICKFKLTISVHNKLAIYLKMINTQRSILYKAFESNLLRPYLTHLYKPLEKMQLIRRRIIVNLRRCIQNDLEDIFMYGIYNLILFSVILLNKSSFTTISRDEIKGLLDGKNTRTIGFSDIDHIENIYQYINETLLPVLHPSMWYDNFPIISDGRMADIANKYMGVVRIRQQRVTRECEVPGSLKFLNVSCCLEYALGNVDFQTYSKGWIPFKKTFGYERLKSIWDYQDEKDTETGFVTGKLFVYSGGGYVAYLGRTLADSLSALAKLQSSNWIDHQSRAIFVEFLIYNANLNLFIAVNLQFEQSATGFSSKFADINVVRMLFARNNKTLIFYILYVIWVALLVLKLGIGIAKNITDFYKQRWLMIDLLINTMTIINISAFMFRMKLINKYLASLEAVENKEFVSHFNLFMLEELMTYFGGILICVATVRLWKFLRFGVFFRILEKTLTMAAIPLFSVTFSFAVILTAYGLSGLIIFGHEDTELSTFIRIVATLIQLSLKPDQFDLTEYVTYRIAYFYFASYLMLMQIILLLYVTVIIMAYVKAQLELSVEPDRYTVFDYIHERLDHIPRLLKTKLHRLRGGQREDSPITPKADEFRYANCLGVQESRLHTMIFIVSCVVRNLNQTVEQKTRLTEYEVTLMRRVCQVFVLKSYEEDKINLFFKGHLVGERVQLIDETKIIRIADFVEAMFGDQDISESRESDKTVVRCSQLTREKIQILQRARLRMKLMALRLSKVQNVLDA